MQTFHIFVTVCFVVNGIEMEAPFYSWLFEMFLHLLHTIIYIVLKKWNEMDSNSMKMVEIKMLKQKRKNYAHEYCKLAWAKL